MIVALRPGTDFELLFQAHVVVERAAELTGIGDFDKVHVVAGAIGALEAELALLGERLEARVKFIVLAGDEVAEDLLVVHDQLPVGRKAAVAQPRQPVLGGTHGLGALLVLEFDDYMRLKKELELRPRPERNDNSSRTLDTLDKAYQPRKKR